VLERDKQEKIVLLKEIKNAFLKRDIDESGVSDADKFYNLLVLLASQTANLVNRNELANTIGVDNKTIEKYLYVLQKCFHIDLVKPFHSNIRKELIRMPKVYFKDPGMRNVALNRFFDLNMRDDTGALIENYVFNRLSHLYDRDIIRFWRTADKKEIDFIVSTSFNKGLAYEVKMTCKQGHSISEKTFSLAYSNYTLETISYHPDPMCVWILSL
jgi:predicted AAA+ superfamily ATPase